jgi:tRNA/tmRNA/rRNA uracil-C5-methylase (TrmA/RlmC/RlmD family)
MEEVPVSRFVEFLLRRVGSRGGVEPLAHLEYEEELALKNEALRDFWKFHQLGIEPEPILASPRPRRYRTTTRRRAQFVGGRLSLGFGQGAGRGESELPPSILEPEGHVEIYRFLVEKGNAPANSSVARNLNYLIVRGSYDAFSVVFNMVRLDGSIVRRLKILGKQLEESGMSVVSAFVFHDPSRSDYYFEREPPPVSVRLKKLFGPARLLLRSERGKYLLPPTSFSQVNESVVPPMLDRIGELLRPAGEERLVDLFCGYGLFALALSPDCGEVYGVDANREAIAAATDSLRFHRPRGKVAFFDRRITPSALARILPASGGEELAILDPPRQGVGAELLAYMALRRPRRIAHIFCGIEAIPGAVATWRENGYRVTRSAPLDMFPGTPNLETLLLLEPVE